MKTSNSTQKKKRPLEKSMRYDAYSADTFEGSMPARQKKRREITYIGAISIFINGCMP